MNTEFFDSRLCVEQWVCHAAHKILEPVEQEDTSLRGKFVGDNVTIVSSGRDARRNTFGGRGVLGEICRKCPHVSRDDLNGLPPYATPIYV